MLCNVLTQNTALTMRHCLRSPPNNVTYSDRFIPSRGASARSIFSALDRDAAEQEAAAKPQVCIGLANCPAYCMLPWLSLAPIPGCYAHWTGPSWCRQRSPVQHTPLC